MPGCFAVGQMHGPSDVSVIGCDFSDHLAVGVIGVDPKPLHLFLDQGIAVLEVIWIAGGNSGDFRSKEPFRAASSPADADRWVDAHTCGLLEVASTWGASEAEIDGLGPRAYLAMAAVEIARKFLRFMLIFHELISY